MEVGKMSDERFEVGATLESIKTGEKCVVFDNGGPIAVRYEGGRVVNWSKSHIRKYYKLIVG